EPERPLMHVEVRHLSGPRPLEHAPALGTGLGGAGSVRANRRPTGRGVPERPRGQRRARGRAGRGLEETPAIHLVAGTDLFHLASPPCGWRADTVHGEHTVVNCACAPAGGRRPMARRGPGTAKKGWRHGAVTLTDGDDPSATFDGRQADRKPLDRRGHHTGSILAR